MECFHIVDFVCSVLVGPVDEVLLLLLLLFLHLLVHHSTHPVVVVVADDVAFVVPNSHFHDVA